MTSLQEALHCLQPTSWDAIPQSPEDLREYVRDIFKKGRLIAESLPDPPPYDSEAHHGRANSPARVVPSSARIAETDPEITSMQKEWGKPIKMGGPKDNPLGVHVWKLSANDGGGQWFGRRSVHNGLPFVQWKKKLSTEYDETLKVNEKKIEKGETPDNSIRGIGAEQKVESMEVKDEDGSVLCQVAVYHVSAQFPRPTAPRDFVALIITSEIGLQIGGTKQPGRSWMMISKPCDHPDVPLKHGYTRGEYESVELIREIPKKGSSQSSSSSSCGNTSEEKESENKSDEACKDAAVEDRHDLEDEDGELIPVEWIMVTRSDPGGNIPRWMVDKGTPKSVGTDAAKFVNWAVGDDEPHNPGNHLKSNPGNSSSENPGPKSNPEESNESLEFDDGNQSSSETDSTDTDKYSHHGLIASVTGLLNTGLERFAPQAFLDYIPHHNQPPHHLPHGVKVTADEADGANDISNSSRVPGSNHHQYDTASPTSHIPDRISLSSTRSDGALATVEMTQNNAPPAELIQMTKTGKLTTHEKELAKLALRKREIDAKLETIRSELDILHMPSQSSPSTPLKGVYNDFDSDTSGMLKRSAGNRSSTPASTGTGTAHSQRGGNDNGNSSDGQSSQAPRTQTQTPEPPAHTHKAASQLFHEESKLLKQLRKVEGSQFKVASKIEARQRKEAERSEKTKSRSEVETLRLEVKELKKEVIKLRSERQKWVDLVTSLQAENTKLASRDQD
ncbi:hypothetical protein N7462_007179 [Penicillium macrosclerotiorum]|uniref:uncharacterized protein n=1 Tax=Penicillium macrosclerotiorum TaxID=303699 RepID=UPI0025499AAA|nr:uncharacterized protein N7462_007179 [Penicillium macrosclerotiorum]KAJ5678935.1 hypothetical protein N7462_007179 [Penicillium macrosclerotiorum]